MSKRQKKKPNRKQIHEDLIIENAGELQQC